MTKPPEEDIYYESPLEIPVRSLGEPSEFIATDSSNYVINNSEEYAPYIPVHPKCLEIAKKVLAYRARILSSDEEEYIANHVGATSLSSSTTFYPSAASREWLVPKA